MSSLAITTTHNVVLDFEAASLGDRILAYILDMLIKGGYLGVIGMIFSGLEASGARIPGMVVFFCLVPFLFYSLLFEIFYNGQTPGKKAMKIQVATLSGYQVTTGQYVLRWLFRLLDISTLSGAVAIIAIAAGGKGQRLGDIVAGTLVISIKQRYRLNDTAYRKTAPDHTVEYENAATLSTSDIATIQASFAGKLHESNPALIQRLADKVALSLGTERYDKPSIFLKQVLADYNHLIRQSED